MIYVQNLSRHTASCLSFWKLNTATMKLSGFGNTCLIRNSILYFVLLKKKVFTAAGPIGQVV